MVSDDQYNRVRYSTMPSTSTHPDRLAAVAALFGMTPAPVTDCRLLELGCGDGANLIPMAYQCTRESTNEGATSGAQPESLATAE
jgi:hypothetical protein